MMARIAKKMMKRTSSSRLDAQARGIKNGYRSGLEEKIAAQIESKGLQVDYETPESRISYQKKPSTYTPDFVLPNGIIIESKGRFLASDRTKHLLIQKQYPEKDIRFVFSNSRQKLSKGAKSTYGEWCVKHGFKYADKLIPEEWFK